MDIKALKLGRIQLFHTTKKFKVTLFIIVLAFIYTLKEEILIGCFHLYSYVDSPSAHRVLGEIYSERAYRNTKNASHHFVIALEANRKKLPLTKGEKRGIIEYIIGTHYECGRGVKPNLEEARKWYAKAVKSGVVGSEDILLRLEEQIKRIVKEQNAPEKQEDQKK